MASNSNITILSNPVKLYEVVDYPKTASEVVAIGDLMQDDGSGGAECVESAANDTFIGVAVSGSLAVDTRPIAIMISGIIKAKVAATSPAATFGQAFAYSAGANGTAWTLTSEAGDGIVWALEPIAAGASGRFLVDVPGLETGIFETVTS